MVSRHIYLQLVFRILLLAMTALLASCFFFLEQYFVSLILILLLVLQTILLIRYVNHTNRKIAYFFEAVKNEDFTLRFPEKLSLKSMEELNHSLNMLNTMIQEIHVKKLAQEQYYQEILKQADIGILTVNTKGHILYANPRIEELLGHRPLNHIRQLTQVDHKLYGLFRELKPFERKLVQLTNERERKQIALKSTSITLNSEELLLVVAQDIHKELDQKETDSWVRLIRVLTHEIMNTITPITSISESILKYYQDSSGGKPPAALTEVQIGNTIKGLEVIRNQGNDLMEFVQSYRSFLNVPVPDKALVPVQRLLERVKILMAQENQPANIQFEASANPLDLELFIDEKQISQVLINLSKNALQSLAGQEKGIIRITAGMGGTEGKFIKVYDNGPGIQPELLDEIFVPFFTTKSSGTGIGLSLSRQIMQLHGGNITVESNDHTTFTLSFA